MNPTPPMICGTLLATMLGAGFSHFWSVQELVAQFPASPAVRSVPIDYSPKKPVAAERSDDLAETPVPQSGDAQKEFFEGMLSEVRALRNENRNLIDQVAETNRDMMQMGFRMDTYSASFRPLPISEDRDDRSEHHGDVSTDENFPSVLPPRASPVYPLDE